MAYLWRKKRVETDAKELPEILEGVLVVQRQRSTQTEMARLEKELGNIKPEDAHCTTAHAKSRRKSLQETEVSMRGKPKHRHRRRSSMKLTRNFMSAS